MSSVKHDTDAEQNFLKRAVCICTLFQSP